MYIIIDENSNPYILQEITPEIEHDCNEGWITILQVEGDRDVSQYLGEDIWEGLGYFEENL